MTPSPILPQLLPPVMHFQWKGSNKEARRPIVTVNSPKDVSQGLL